MVVYMCWPSETVSREKHCVLLVGCTPSIPLFAGTSYQEEMASRNTCSDIHSKC